MEPKQEKPKPARKMRFAPKAPPRRVPKVEVKTEVDEDINAAQANVLLERFHQNSVKTKPKVEKKVSSSQVAFGFGAGSSSLRTFGASKGESRSSGETSKGGVSTPGSREKVYKEPWEYSHIYYPQTLPLRRPYSGNPELLDEDEFALQNSTYDENSIHHAEELGLMEENLQPSMIFLQLPPTLPMIKQAGKTPSSGTVGSTKASSLAELPAGLMGKMLVYKSGAVKLKLGDILYDVSPGMNCIFARDVVAVNTTEKTCCEIGGIQKHVVVSPDLDSGLSHLMSDI